MEVSGTKISEEAQTFGKKYTIGLGGGASKNVVETRIVAEAAADERGRAELLKYGHITQSVEFLTYASVYLGVGDIITISAPDYNVPMDQTKNRFIVTRKQLILQKGKMMTKIKGVRYDR